MRIIREGGNIINICYMIIGGMFTFVKKRSLIKGGCSVYVPGSDALKFLWEVVDNHVVEKTNYNDDIGLLGLDCFDEDK